MRQQVEVVQVNHNRSSSCTDLNSKCQLMIYLVIIEYPYDITNNNMKNSVVTFLLPCRPLSYDD